VSTVQCPNGHASESTDYCDVCGTPIAAAPVAADPTPAPAAAPTTCVNCGAPAAAAALFCETCGYDFTTGSLPVAASTPTPAVPPPASPTPPPAGPDSWVAELWVDPDWYGAQNPEDPMPSAGLPGLVPLRERSVLVGRPSVSRNIHPQVDCGTDSGVSRRHCQLNTDGQRWWVEDLQSANGTYVSKPGEPVPTTPIPVGQRRELEDGDRLFLGGWTRIVIRKALPGEV
jgi:FHA domain/Double zinc ribbon